MKSTHHLRLAATAAAAVLALSSNPAHAWDFTQNGNFATNDTTSWTQLITGNGSVNASTGAAVLVGGAANSGTGTYLIQQLTSSFTDFVTGYHWYDISFSYSGVGSYKVVSAASEGAAALVNPALTVTLATGNVPSALVGSDGLLGSALSSVGTSIYTQYFSTKETYDSASTPNLYLVFNAARNQSLTIDNVNAVPEPETYAMLLAGLGAIGFMSRRRKALS